MGVPQQQHCCTLFSTDAAAEPARHGRPGQNSGVSTAGHSGICCMHQSYVRDHHSVLTATLVAEQPCGPIADLQDKVCNPGVLHDM